MVVNCQNPLSVRSKMPKNAKKICYKMPKNNHMSLENMIYWKFGNLRHSMGANM